MRCGSAATLSEAWVALTDPVTLTRLHPAASATLLRSAREMRTWADAYGYLLLARGDMDVMIDPIVNPWDVAPLSVIVREAGGVFSRLSGEIDDLGGDCIASCTPTLHEAVVAAFR